MIIFNKKKFCGYSLISKFLILFIFWSVFVNTAFAVWDGNFYDPGETHNPECLPSDTNCDVSPAVVTESDPFYISSSWYGTTNNSADWDTAYSWGNHSGLYDLVGTASGLMGTHESSYNHSLIATALQSESDPVFTIWDKSTGISITESQISDLKNYALNGSNISNFINDAGYLTSFSETDPFSLHLDQTVPQIISNGAPYFSGGIKTGLIYPNTDSTTALQINKADGLTNVLNVDTTNGRVGNWDPIS